MATACSKPERAAQTHSLLTEMKAKGDFIGLTTKNLSAVDTTIALLATMKQRVL